MPTSTHVTANFARKRGEGEANTWSDDRIAKPSRGGRGTNHGFQDDDDARQERGQAHGDDGTQSLHRGEGRAGEEGGEGRRQARRGLEDDRANGNGRPRDDTQGRHHEARRRQEDDTFGRGTTLDGVQGGSPGTCAPEERWGRAQVGDGDPRSLHRERHPRNGRSLGCEPGSTRERCGSRDVERLKLVPKEGLEPPTRRV